VSNGCERPAKAMRGLRFQELWRRLRLGATEQEALARLDVNQCGSPRKRSTCRPGELMRSTISPLHIAAAAALTFGWAATAAPSALAFGALAVDASQGTRQGASSDQPTVAAARERALAECGAGCTVVVTFHRFCAAFAADRAPGSPSWGRAGGSTQAEAQDKAIDYCRLYDGKACQVRVSGV
jgi:uncharacterized protein DUF4189